MKRPQSRQSTKHLLPFLLLGLSAAGCGGGGGGGPAPAPGGGGTVSGQVTAPGGNLSRLLESPIHQQQAVRRVQVELVRLNSAGAVVEVLASATTDDNGNFVITVPSAVTIPAPDLAVRVRTSTGGDMRAPVTGSSNINVRPTTEAALQRFFNYLQANGVAITQVNVADLGAYIADQLATAAAAEGNTGTVQEAIARVNQFIDGDANRMTQTTNDLDRLRDTGSVVGRVVNASGGQAVSSFTARTDTGTSAAGNMDGTFTISRVHPGSRTVTITATGFIGFTTAARTVSPAAATDFGTISLTAGTGGGGTITTPPPPPFQRALN